MSFRPYPRYKASGVEWLGEVPSHWEIRQSRRLFSLRTERARKDDRQLTASQKHGILLQEDFARIEGQKVMEVIKGADILKHVEPGDFVISMRSFEGGLEYSRTSGAISSAYVALVPSRAAVHSFFGRLFKSDRYIQALQSTTNLVRDGQALRFSNFTQVDLPLPTATEQATIAAFLAHETAKIDTLIAKQERLIELLQEKRQAIISHAVTKGLNPEAPMKPSGVEWLGDVPAHWNVTRLSFCCSGISTGPFGSDLHAEDYVEDGRPVINPANLTHGRIVSDPKCTVDEDTAKRLSVHWLSVEDIVVGRRGEMGRCSVVGTDECGWICGTGCLRISPSHSVALPHFLQLTIQSQRVREWLSLQSVGSTMENLNGSILGRVPLPLPPIAEQSEILKYVAEQSKSFGCVIKRASTAIALMRERRTALISAAVTGKIDVREVQ